MNLNGLFDPLFRVPFLVGLILAIALPPLGILMRLRNEWLAALGLAHLAGATGLIGLATGVPVVIGAPLGAMTGAVIKNIAKLRGNTIYALMILAGWSATILIAANTALGSAMGHSLVEGQLYFSGLIQLVTTLALGLLTLVSLPWMVPQLILAQLFPGHQNRDRLNTWRLHLSFDALIALSMAIGTGTLGLMGAFALVFIPPWVAFRIAKNWRVCMWLSLLFGLSSYLLAFILAFVLDQPFGPMLVALLLLGAGGEIYLRQRYI